MNLSTVIKAHDGWVHDVKFDAENEWFATASADQTIKVWDIASGALKLVLTGHRMGVRSLAISAQMPYMFSGSEDKEVFCWDLEHNKVVRTYHGHRSGVYTVGLHPEIPYLLASGSRDQSVRLWDVRTRTEIHVLNHDEAVNCVALQSDEPQLISGSQDRSVKLWDIVGGKCRETLTNHSHSVRSLAIHPTEYTFVAGGKDGVQQYVFPNGELLGTFNEGLSAAFDEFTSQNALEEESIYTMDYVDSNLLVGGELGQLYLLDSEGQLITTAKAGSPVLSAASDMSGTRVVTGHVDKCVRVWQC